MAEISKVTLRIPGQEMTVGEGDIEKEFPSGTPVALEAAVEPSGAAVEKWEWKKGEELVPNEATNSLSVDLTKEKEGRYTAEATPGVGGKAAISNAVILKVTEEDESPKNVAEVEIGEYDRTFASLTAIVLLILTLIGVLLLVQDLSLKLPGIGEKAPESGSYPERLRAFTVVAAVSTGILTMGVGIWLAGLEVRGRLRKTVSVTTPSVTERRGLFEDAAKLLETASKLRGTIAVLVAATALLLGALWTTGQVSNPSPTSSPSPSPSST